MLSGLRSHMHSVCIDKNGVALFDPDQLTVYGIIPFTGQLRSADVQLHRPSVPARTPPRFCRVQRISRRIFQRNTAAAAASTSAADSVTTASDTQTPSAVPFAAPRAARTAW